MLSEIISVQALECASAACMQLGAYGRNAPPDHHDNRILSLPFATISFLFRSCSPMGEMYVEAISSRYWQGSVCDCWGCGRGSHAYEVEIKPALAPQQQRQGSTATALSKDAFSRDKNRVARATDPLAQACEPMGLTNRAGRRCGKLRRRGNRVY